MTRDHDSEVSPSAVASSDSRKDEIALLEELVERDTSSACIGQGYRAAMWSIYSGAHIIMHVMAYEPLPSKLRFRDRERASGLRKSRAWQRSGNTHEP